MACRRRMTRGGRLLRAGALALTRAALLQVLRTPADQRTWQGGVRGAVPYDFRRPTLARLRERMWNPDDERLVMPQVFGVGWTVSGRPAALLRAPVSTAGEGQAARCGRGTPRSIQRQGAQASDRAAAEAARSAAAPERSAEAAERSTHLAE